MTSYEAQKSYYTDKIMQNPQWSMAGIFADEGITGTSAEKRPEFLRMIRLCRKRKIDLILVKSISRFARNTVDCLHYIRALKELGIAVIFEKENINTLDSEGEMLITLLGAFAQAESESISQNVRWGIRQAMREGRVSLRCKSLYGFTEDENGQPQVVPDEAEVVRRIYKSFLRGQSIRMIKGWLDAEGIAPRKGKEWSLSTIENILKNEKYCGDVLLQKTFISDCISRKIIKNVDNFPCTLLRTTTKESSAGKFIKLPRRSLHVEVLAAPPTNGRLRPGSPAIHPGTPSATGLSAGNAGLSIAAVPGSARVVKRSSGDAAADWTTAADTANILPQWRREPFREQSWQR